MTDRTLVDTVRTLVGRGKGLLAIDESPATCNQRFAAAGIDQTSSARRDWRELMAATPSLSDWVSGAILCDETLRQTTAWGGTFTQAFADAGIVVGVKVDAGAVALAGHPGERVTEGLDGLGARLASYAGMGARFAKWRAVFSIGDGLPTPACIHANAHALARYAALCQQAGIVPIVEPEVLMEGDHDAERCGHASEAVLAAMFAELRDQGVALEGLILKPAMVLAGEDNPTPAPPDEVAAATIDCFLRVAPAAVGGVAFLSGGQSGPQAAARLNAMNVQARAGVRRAPWPLTFSFARAIQHPALDIWHGATANARAAQAALAHRAHCSWAAANGAYRPEMEDGTP